MPYNVSPNGFNNVGKTIQIELLPSHYTIFKAGRLHDSEKKIGETAFSKIGVESRPMRSLCVPSLVL